MSAMAIELMNVDYDVLIYLIDFHLKDSSTLNLGRTSNFFNDLVCVVCTKKCKLIIQHFGKYSKSFEEQGINLLSKMTLPQLSSLTSALKECFRQKLNVKRQLRVLRYSNHPELFLKCVKLNSNKLFNQFCPEQFKENVNVPAIIDDKSERDMYSQIEELVETQIFPWYNKFDMYDYSDDIKGLISEMMAHKNPLKKYQRYLKIETLQKHLSSNSRPKLFLNLFKKNLKVEQIESSLKSLETNLHFKGLPQKAQNSVIDNYLGEMCLHQEKSFEGGHMFIQLVACFFDFNLVKNRFKKCEELQIPLPNATYVENMLRLPNETFELIFCLNFDSDWRRYLVSLYIQPENLSVKLVRKILTNSWLIPKNHDYQSLSIIFYFFIPSDVFDFLRSEISDLSKKSRTFILYQEELFEKCFGKTIDQVKDIDIRELIVQMPFHYYP